MKKDRPERFGASPEQRRRVNALRRAYRLLEPVGESPFDDNGLRQDIDILSDSGLLRANPNWDAICFDPICYRVKTVLVNPDTVPVRWEPDDE